MSQDADEAHQQKMQALQEEMHAKIRSAREKRGLVIVHTGNGKGKTTAAFGMVARSLAHGKRVQVVQFIKASNDAVAKLLESPLLSWHHFGEGFTWDTQNRAGDIACCRQGWDVVLKSLADPELSLLVLDELNVVLEFDYLPIEEVLEALRARSPQLHVVITGRNALPELMEYADLVSEMREIKHPFAKGVQAQRGIEF
ncbi:cob(I)yrinic acid a,c-diamide adenosyltransferase [Nibricoccus sp. IMCC34717]|uniref:cob(I)yrinic acid a,c-diamide adenosyltransferase n=1 Tax=Nibricoccus sp. IMCC34717 TaxID=3034021 RepID=UPI00384B7A0C